MLRTRAPLRRTRLKARKRRADTPFIVRRDLSEVCLDNAAGKREYRRRVVEMARRQNWTCSICGKPMHLGDPPTFEHTDGRGMGGGHRDDRISINGKPYNSAAHGSCNWAKGSRRGKVILKAAGEPQWGSGRGKA